MQLLKTAIRNACRHWRTNTRGNVFQTFRAGITAQIAVGLLLLITFHPALAGAQNQKPREYQPIESWRNDVLYAVFVDRFHQPGANDLSVWKNRKNLTSFQGGTLSGLSEKLDYIKSLGATTIVLNPVTPSDGYHGYHPVEHFSIAPELGTLKDFDDLVAAAHARGLKLLFDFVSNHVSPKSPLVKQHPDWFHDPKKYGVYHFVPVMTVEERFRATYFGLPDFDQSKEEVYQYLLRFAKFWIDHGIDGFRMDAVNLIEPEYWRRLNAEIKAYAGKDFFILGEIYDLDFRVLNEYLKDFDGIYDFTSAYSIRNVFAAGDSARALRRVSAYRKLYSNQDILLSPMIDNHDMTRFVSMEQRSFGAWDKQKAERRFEQALIFLMTQPGMPYLLYGTEIELGDAPSLDKLIYDRSRNLMQFKDNEKSKSFQFLRNLIELRKINNWGQGTRADLNVNDEQLVSILKVKEEIFIIIHNLENETPIRITTSVLGRPPGLLKDLLNGKEYLAADESYVVPVEKNESKILHYLLAFSPMVVPPSSAEEIQH